MYGIEKTDTSWFARVNPRVVFLIIAEEISQVPAQEESNFLENWEHPEKYTQWTIGGKQVIGFSRENYYDLNNQRYLPMMWLVARDGDDLLLDSQIENVNIRFCNLLRELNLLPPCS